MSNLALWKLFVLGTLAARASAVGAEAPSSEFNLPGQARTRTCVASKGEKVPLRFADGTPTGWFAHGDDPSQQGGNHQPCGPGTLEMDVHEVLTAASGMKLYFHPGGGPSHYRDHVEHGQYGHIALEDLKWAPPPAGDINGKPAPLGGVRYFITPTRIPFDLWYKPNVSHGHSGSTYYTYGNPGYDKTGGRGDWTYLNWSWVQNGGAVYPKNKCGGGGMVRALAKRDSVFDACRVEAIIGYSYGPDNQVNGRVTACYGRAFAGPDEQGAEIYGWLPHSYQRNGGLIVPCLRRAEVKVVPTTSAPASTNRLERMAWNLVHPMQPNAETIHVLFKRYQSEAEPMARMELLTELSRMDAAQTVSVMLQLLGGEKEPRVREQALVLLGFMACTTREMSRVSAALAKSYPEADEQEKHRMLDVVSNIPTPESAQWVLARWRAGGSQSERLAAGDAILKLAPRVKMDEALVSEAQKPRAGAKVALGEPE